MTLREELQNRKGELVHIGSKSGFFWIDTVGDSTEKDLEQLGNDFCEWLSRNIVSGTADYEYSERWVERHKKQLLKLINERPEASTEDLGEAISEWKNKCKTMEVDITDRAAKAKAQRNTVENWKKRLSTFKAFLDRECKEVYPRITGGIAIILPGEERGAFWDK